MQISNKIRGWFRSVITKDEQVSELVRVLCVCVCVCVGGCVYVCVCMWVGVYCGSNIGKRYEPVILDI